MLTSMTSCGNRSKPLDRERDHYLRYRRGGPNSEFLRDAGLHVVDNVTQVFDLAENNIYLIKDISPPLRRHQPAAAPVKESYAQRLLSVLHQSADSGRRHVE